jgi:hypothetical protein
LPISWQIRDGLVWAESSGESSVDDVRAAVEAFLDDPAYKPGMGLVHDVRRRRVPDAQEVQQAVSFVASRAREIGRARWGIVVSSDAAFGMGRMVGALLESSSSIAVQGSSVTAHVFRDVDEAEAWVRGSD